MREPKHMPFIEGGYCQECRQYGERHRRIYKPGQRHSECPRCQEREINAETMLQHFKWLRKQAHRILKSLTLVSRYTRLSPAQKMDLVEAQCLMREIIRLLGGRHA
jgi:hypothetical protein